MNNRREDMEIASHYRHLLHELNEQRQHGILCDVCVVVEGKVFKAHKNVLLGSSRYFKTLYCQVQKASDQATVTHLDIVTAQGFKAIIDFMYSAHLALTSRNVIEVMSAASFLQMTDIVQACHDFIKAALDISIKPDASDELSEFEVGAPPGSGADALISAVMAGRSISPWLARRTSPANSSGDSAIASCHEGGSSYGKEDQEPKADGPDDLPSQPLWPGDMGCGPLHVKEEQLSPTHYGGSEPPSAGDAAIQNSFSEQAAGDGWQPTGRRKNRKNKDTVRHITQHAEDDSRAGSPLPSFLPTSGWPFGSRDSSKPFVCYRPGSGALGPRAAQRRCLSVAPGPLVLSVKWHLSRLTLVASRGSPPSVVNRCERRESGRCVPAGAPGPPAHRGCWAGDFLELERRGDTRKEPQRGVWRSLS